MRAQDQSKVVGRDELYSPPSTPDSCPASPWITDVLEARLSEAYEPSFLVAADIVPANDATIGSVEETEEYDFRLFSRPHTQGIQQHTDCAGHRIVLDTLSTVSSLLHATARTRPDTYYFTGRTSEEQLAQYHQAAVSAVEVVEGSRRPWPGCALPWRVTVVSQGRWQSNLREHTGAERQPEQTSGHRKRAGKKRRLAIRKLRDRSKAKEDAESQSKAEKDAAEREKRTRRNREKKVKRKERDKNKKQAQQEVQA